MNDQGPPIPPPDLGLALVGYRGTGKSTVGAILARRLGRGFADVDKMIESMAGRPIRDIFEQDGEGGFRLVEARAIAGVADLVGPGGVVATGGGSILMESNRLALRDFGVVVWLAADPSTLAERLRRSRGGVDQRPALTAAGTLEEIAGVLESRTPLYREVAHATVDTAGLSLDQVADEVLRAWAGHGVRS